MKQINEYLEKPINESQVYDDIIKSLQESKEQGKPIVITFSLTKKNTRTD